MGHDAAFPFVVTVIGEAVRDSVEGRSTIDGEDLAGHHLRPVADEEQAGADQIVWLLALRNALRGKRLRDQLLRMGGIFEVAP